MQAIRNSFRIITFVIIISLCINKLNAQTPADDPGIGGPGTSGSAPAGDGAPIVPFDGEMNLMFLITGVCYASYVYKSRLRPALIV